MIKKLFCGLMAASMLFATSCQQQELTPAMEGEATVTFNVGTPEIATRAYSDGKSATHFQYAVYDENGKELKDLTLANGEIHGTTTVNLKLKTGSQYSVLFWAAAPNAPYEVDLSDATMRVDYTNAFSNDETRDAFYKYITFDVTGAQSMDVELKRPFAQLNIGTADYTDAAKAGFVPTQSYVKVPVYTTLNFKDGNVGGQEVRTFDWADFNRAEKFPVTGYEYMAMNYLLVSAEKEVVEVEFGYREGQDEEVRTVGAVPVQRNYRTNIFGNLITSDIDIKVTIDPEYETPDFNILEAMNGGVVTLPCDVQIARPLVVKKNTVLNLNGFTLSNRVDNNLTDVIIVEAGAELTINGEGTIEAVSGNDGYAVISEGSVIINGGTFKSGVDTNCEPNAVIYARGYGKVFVNGGQFPNDNASKFVLNKKDADRATTTIEVRGGTFYNFNPENNAAEGANTNFVPAGHIVLEEGDVYTVVAGAFASDETSLKDALSNEYADVVVLEENVDISDVAAPYVHIAREVVIKGQYNELEVGNSANYGIFCNAGSVVTFDDVNVVSNGGGIVARDGAQVVFNDGSLKIESTQTSQRYLVYAFGTGTTVTIKDGEFSFEQYRKRGYAYVADGAVLYIEGGVFGAASTHPTNPTAPLIADGGEIIITGGTFGFDPSAYVAAGYKAVKSGSTWTVVEE